MVPFLKWLERKTTRGAMIAGRFRFIYFWGGCFHVSLPAAMIAGRFRTKHLFGKLFSIQRQNLEWNKLTKQMFSSKPSCDHTVGRICLYYTGIKTSLGCPESAYFLLYLPFISVCPQSLSVHLYSLCMLSCLVNSLFGGRTTLFLSFLFLFRVFFICIYRFLYVHASFGLGAACRIWHCIVCSLYCTATWHIHIIYVGVWYHITCIPLGWGIGTNTTVCAGCRRAGSTV